MKKNIPILILFLCMISCIREDDSDCESGMNIVFQLADQFSTGDYDSDIGNDVHLQLFRQGNFYHAITIPYEQIKDSKPYALADIEAQTQLLAYAIPAGQPGTIRVPTVGENYYEQELRMQLLTGSTYYKPNEGNLYLGQENVNRVIKQNPTYIINMIPCYAKITVIIMDAFRFNTDFPGIPGIGIQGTAGVFRIHDRQTSQPVPVLSQVRSDNGTYTTDILYLLAEACTGQTISVEVYSDSNLVMYLNTEQKSVAGKEIIIRIYAHNLTAEITVDGWTYKTQVTTP